MKPFSVLLVSFLTVLSPVQADYELGPPETYLASEDIVVVDASILKITEQGFVELNIHEVVVGKSGPEILQHIALNCEDPTMASSTGMAKGKRYVFVTKGNDLLEWTTFWEVVRSLDGELKCYYSGAEEVPKETKVTMPRSGLHSLDEFKDRVQAVAAAARKRSERIAITPAEKTDDLPPIKTASDLAKRNHELANELQNMKRTLRQTNMELLSYLSNHLDGTPLNQARKGDAVQLAVKLAPTERGNPLIWRVLHETEILHDAITREAAERLLGPPTSVAEDQLEWYFNPSGRHVAPYLRANLNKGILSGWQRGNR